ncbi:BON domain-containing protein [Phytohabitans sp. LJ34]|uniref:BON domain-containing protein n=1 Tax=Phytohabitans sp. LJ34 TaxID=3452217 RepID=UPI003F8CD061
MAVLWPYPEDAFFYRAQPGRSVDREDVDQAVAEGVLARLLGHDVTGDQPIHVDVQNRVAVLTGSVDSSEMIGMAGDLAWQAPGIVDVCNALTVRT